MLRSPFLSILFQIIEVAESKAIFDDTLESISLSFEPWGGIKLSNVKSIPIKLTEWSLQSTIIGMPLPMQSKLVALACLISTFFRLKLWSHPSRGKTNKSVSFRWTGQILICFELQIAYWVHVKHHVSSLCSSLPGI